MELLLSLVLWLASVGGTVGVAFSGTNDAKEASTTWASRYIAVGSGAVAITTHSLKRPLRQGRARPKAGSMARTVEYLAAFLRDIEMKESQSYLERGRQFAAIPVDALNARWAAAFEAATTNAGRQAMVEYADLSAEFRLRDLPMPAHLVSETMAVVRQRIYEAEPEDFQVIEEGLRRFTAEMRRPKN